MGFNSRRVRATNQGTIPLAHISRIAIDTAHFDTEVKEELDERACVSLFTFDTHLDLEVRSL